MEYLLISTGILVVLNITVSIYLFKRDDLELFQKTAQIIVVWLIPYIGAIGLWLFNRSQDDNVIQDKDVNIKNTYVSTTGGD